MCVCWSAVAWDEYEIERLVTGGAPIDMFGVGTRVGVSGDAPWCDLVYKMVCYDGRPVMKLSGGKESLPGEKQVFRRHDADGTMLKGRHRVGSGSRS